MIFIIKWTFEKFFVDVIYFQLTFWTFVLPFFQPALFSNTFLYFFRKELRIHRVRVSKFEHTPQIFRRTNAHTLSVHHILYESPDSTF